MPQLLRIDAHEPSPALIARAGSKLRARGLVIYPTETFYGLGGDPFDEAAVERLFEAKGRPRGMPLPLIVADEEVARRCVAGWSETAGRLAGAFWPGPLTLVLPAAAALPRTLLGQGRTVGLRVSPHPVAGALARAAGGAIVATSANRSGQDPPADPGRIASALRAAVDLILDAGPTHGKAPSTVLDLSVEPFAHLRAGAVPIASIERVLGRPLA